MVIFWGSQSGTAEGLANRLGNEISRRYGLKALCADLSEYNPDSIQSIASGTLAVFILSTYGEGEPSDNASDTWQWLHSSQPIDLKNLEYVAFGLGNSNYHHYNRVIDETVSKLNSCRANIQMPIGRADDAQGKTEEHFLDWKKDLLKLIQERFGVQDLGSNYQPRLQVVEDDSLDIMDLHSGEPYQSTLSSGQSPVHAVPIANAYELFKDSSRNCIHIDLDVSTFPKLRYTTGDYAVVWPVNPEEEVQRLLRILGLADKKDVPISIKSLEKGFKTSVPSPTTPYHMFRSYLEIGAPVSRDSISLLAQFAPSDFQRSLLENLASDRDSYSLLIKKHHINLGRLLEYSAAADGKTFDMAWDSLPLSVVIEMISALHPRLYSISSSSILDSRHPSITALAIQTPLVENVDQLISGVTSNFLHQKSQEFASSGSSSNGTQDLTLNIAIRKSKFRLPPATTPIIMVAAGTGLAPFRAFLLERARLHSMGQTVGPTWLFFGCRSPSEDYIYEEDLSQAVKSLPGAVVTPAFSRVAKDDANYGYVQDRIRHHAAEVSKLIVEGGARVYVCGRAAMSREVATKLRNSIQRLNGWDNTQVEEWWMSFRKQGGFREDVWG